MILRSLLIVAFMAGSAGANDVQPASHVDIEIGRDGLASLICPIPNSTDRFVSRAFAVQQSEPGAFELLIATRHAVGDFQSIGSLDCWVRGPEGRHYDIEQIHYSDSIPDVDHDWLVIRTSRPFPRNAVRLRVASTHIASRDLPEIALIQQNRNAPNCNILAETDIFYSDGALFAHDCHTRPGLSGSPIMVASDGNSVVIGFHIGRLMEYSGGSREQYGLARWIDAEIEHAIMDLASTAN